MTIRFQILLSLALTVLKGYDSFAIAVPEKLYGQTDSLIILWDQLTLKSIQFETSFQKDPKLKREYKDLLKAYHWKLGDSSQINNSLRKQFVEKYPETFEHKDIIIIEVVSSGEKITHTNIIMSFDNADSIKIDLFKFTLEGWKKFKSLTGRYFHINSDLKEYKSTNGNNFDQITMTHFNYQMPTTSEYFLPWTLASPICDLLNIN